MWFVQTRKGMIPGAHTMQMLIEGNPYYWTGLIIIALFLAAIVWNEMGQ